MNDVKVSIIVPVYNGESTIKRCVDSIINQSFRSIEVLIIDDGSEDRTAQICGQIKTTDDRIRVFSQKNQGVSAARNLGIRQAMGQFLMFVDGDDEVKKDYVSAYVSEIEKNNADIVIGGITKVFEGSLTNNKVLIPQIEMGLCDSNRFWNSVCLNSELYGYLVNKIFRTEIIRNHHLLLRTDMFSQEDLDFCLSVYPFCKRIVFIDDASYVYYITEGKRIPPIHHFIANQLKLINTARSQVKLTRKSEEAVYRRVSLWVFSMLLASASSYKKFRETIKMLNQIDGLRIYLKPLKSTNEKTFISKLFYRKLYLFIYVYLRCREVIKRMAYYLWKQKRK